MLIHPRNAWHVRQLYELRKSKEPRAELRGPLYPVRNRIEGEWNLRRLLRGLAERPGVLGHGDRVSDPLIMYGMTYRLHAWDGRKRKMVEKKKR